jgi:hypothetical protein
MSVKEKPAIIYLPHKKYLCWNGHEQYYDDTWKTAKCNKMWVDSEVKDKEDVKGKAGMMECKCQGGTEN